MMSYQHTHSLIENCQWDRHGHAIHSLQKNVAPCRSRYSSVGMGLKGKLCTLNLLLIKIKLEK